MGLRIKRGRVDRAVSPRKQVAEVKPIACERARTHELPLPRFSRVELHRLAIERGVSLDDLAVAARGCDQAVADALLDRSARPGVHREAPVKSSPR